MNRRKFNLALFRASSAVLLSKILPSYASAAESISGAAKKSFDLTIGKTRLKIGGRLARGITVNRSIPGPLLRFKEGDDVTINVTNTLGEDSSIHWHGLILPNNMDGVPKVTFPGISPGETFTYKIPIRQSGTYWYHSHSGLQEQSGHYGPIIIDPKSLIHFLMIATTLSCCRTGLLTIHIGYCASSRQSPDITTIKNKRSWIFLKASPRTARKQPSQIENGGAECEWTPLI